MNLIKWPAHILITVIPILHFLSSDKHDVLLGWMIASNIVLHLSIALWNQFGLVFPIKTPLTSNWCPPDVYLPRCSFLLIVGLLTISKIMSRLASPDSPTLTLFVVIQLSLAFTATTLTMVSTLTSIFLLIGAPNQTSDDKKRAIEVSWFLTSIFLAVLSSFTLQFHPSEAQPLQSTNDYMEYFFACNAVIEYTPKCSEVKTLWGTFFISAGLFQFMWLFGVLVGKRTGLPLLIANRNLLYLTFQLFMTAAEFVIIPWNIYTYIEMWILIQNRTMIICHATPSSAMISAMVYTWILLAMLFVGVNDSPRAIVAAYKEISHELKECSTLVRLKRSLRELNNEIHEAGKLVDPKEFLQRYKHRIKQIIPPFFGLRPNLLPDILLKDEQCCICLESLEDNKKKVVFSKICLHVFHRNCLKNWVQTHQECPLCKQVW